MDDTQTHPSVPEGPNTPSKLQEKLGLFRNGVLTEILTTSRAAAENKIIGMMNAGDESDWEIFALQGA